MKIGDKVRLVGIPDLSSIPDDVLDELKTKETLENAQGKIFEVIGVNEFGMAELEIPNIDDDELLDTVFIEPEFLEVI